MPHTGRLFLIPQPIGDDLSQLPQATLERLADTKLYAVENLKPARRFVVSVLKSLSRWENDLSGVEFLPMKTFDEQNELCMRMQNGEDVGVISDAGVPGVADPGQELVRLAQEFELPIRPLVGPSSILLAAMSSGLNGQSFAFVGYLPIDKKQRSQRIRQLEARAIDEGQTQLFIETPYRNQQLMAAILKACRKETRLSISAGLFTQQQFIGSKSIETWQRKGLPDLHKVPAVFALGT